MLLFFLFFCVPPTSKEIYNPTLYLYLNTIPFYSVINDYLINKHLALGLNLKEYHSIEFCCNSFFHDSRPSKLLSYDCLFRLSFQSELLFAGKINALCHINASDDLFVFTDITLIYKCVDISVCWGGGA